MLILAVLDSLIKNGKKDVYIHYVCVFSLYFGQTLTQ